MLFYGFSFILIFHISYYCLSRKIVVLSEHNNSTTTNLNVFEGWLFSFLFNFISYWRFLIKTCFSICTHRSFITIREPFEFYFINPYKLFISMKQTAFFPWLNLTLSSINFCKLKCHSTIILFVSSFKYSTAFISISIKFMKIKLTLNLNLNENFNLTPLKNINDFHLIFIIALASNETFDTFRLICLIICCSIC